ncbi:MAG TPA: phosphoserine phosphatase SerB [Candidatus Acidoferrales bacterium]|nr:phosphoserine phosphatase SerB [Candidatus Acidoferrales bacterium]
MRSELISSRSGRLFCDGSATLIVFDMDGTLIDAETIDELANAANVGNRVAAITKRAMRGEIDFEDALKERVKLLKGLTVAEVDAVIQKIPLMNGAEQLISELRKTYRIAMVSGGFTVVADKIAGKLGIDFAIANELEIEGGFLTGKVSGPLMRQNSKKDVLEEIAIKEGISTKDCIVIGDGANDISMFKAAGFSIAFNANPILQDASDVIITEKDLRLILPILKGGK